MPWAVAAAAVAAGGSIHAGNQAGDAAAGAADDAYAAEERARNFQEQATGRARERLQPYADQEAIGRNQMMRQLGLTPSTSFAPAPAAQMGQPVAPGSNVVAGPGYQMGGGGAGYGQVPLGDPSDQRTFDQASQRQFGNFLNELLQRNITAAYGSGFHRTKGVRQGTRHTVEQLRELQDAGRIPADIALPGYDDLLPTARELVQNAGGHNGLIRNQREGDGLFSFRGQSGRPVSDTESLMALADRSGITEGGGGKQNTRRALVLVANRLARNPLAQLWAVNHQVAHLFIWVVGDMHQVANSLRRMRQGHHQQPRALMISATTWARVVACRMARGALLAFRLKAAWSLNSIRVPVFLVPPWAVLKNIQSIQGRAGVLAPTQAFQERYYQDIESPTPQFGMGYTENPAYQAMIEETMDNVNQFAANAGGLYSGRRGEALREASARTQMDFYRDLADREQRAHEMGLQRRGAAVGALQGREDEYYANYMNLLSNLAAPTTATNIANIEVGQAGDIAQGARSATANANRYNLMGQQAQGAAQADAARAIGQGIATAFGS